MTKLEAINIMLSVVGESPLTDISENEDATLATQILGETNSSVQTFGWNFNTEVDVSLHPDIVNKHITLPINTARIEPVDRNIIIRQGKLYDKTKHTYIFDSSQKVDIVYILEYEDIPLSAQYYIALKASRIFQCRCLSSNELIKDISFEEMDALKTFKRADGATAQYNMLTDNFTSLNITRKH